MTYLNSENGAVTVDWVVLTAGLVGLGLATMAVVSTGVQDTSGDIDDQLSSNDIISASFAAEPSYVPSYDWENHTALGLSQSDFDYAITDWQGYDHATMLALIDTTYAAFQAGQNVNIRTDQLVAMMYNIEVRGDPFPENAAEIEAALLAQINQ